MMLSQLYTLLPLLTSLALAGDLNVKQDTSVSATKGHKDGQYVWTSILDLEKKDKITDGEMIKVAHEASQEMRSSWDSAPKDKKPSIMTVMEIDNQLYLSSSMKGDYSFIYEYKTKGKDGKVGDGTIRKSVPKEIASALGNAKSAGSSENRNNVQHKNDASCGELMASYTYLLKNSGQSLKEKKPKRTVAWLYTKDRTGKEVEKAWDPCGTDEDEAWGCDLFCKQMGFTPVSVKTEEAKAVPKITKTEQQKLMTSELRKELDAMNKETDEANKKKQQEKQDQKKKDKENKDDKKDDKEEKKEDKKESKEEKKEDKKESKGKRGMNVVSWSA